MLKIKQIGALLVTMSAMLVLFAGCGDKEDGGDKESLATLVAETVSSSTTTNRISTQGPSGITFEAQIVSQGGDTEWCSFDLNKQVSSVGGNVGDPVYLYLKQNSSDADRKATIDVTYTNGYSTSLTLTQKAANTSFGYDRAKHVSHWVAYPIYRDYTSSRTYQTGPGTQGRTDAWAYDDWATEYTSSKPYYRQTGTKIFEPAIPERDQANVVNYFSGYQRGHMLPSASRYSTWETNAQTFFATNMMPQNGSFNSGSWATLEGKVRSWGGLQKYDTLYVVTGTYFSNSYKTMSNTNVGGSIRVAVPDKCWKVLLRQRGNQNKSVSELPASELKAIAFVFDNASSSENTELKDAACSVKEIETLTGFTFFRNLDPAVADEVKGNYNYSDWN